MEVRVIKKNIKYIFCLLVTLFLLNSETINSLGLSLGQESETNSSKTIILGQNSNSTINLRALSIEQRIEYQRTIEMTYWQRRFVGVKKEVFEKEFNETMTDFVVRNKVEDYIQKTEALKIYFGIDISGELLQNEMNTIAENSALYPDLVKIWNALNNDPYIIAECYVRPLLAEKMLKTFYENNSDETKFFSTSKKENFELWWTKESNNISLSSINSNYNYQIPKISPNQSSSLINNGGFESGSFPPWQTFDGGGKVFVLNVSSVAHSGSFYAIMGGDDSVKSQNIRQFFDIPNTASSVAASLFLNITSDEILNDQLDTIDIVVLDPGNGQILRTFERRSNLSKSPIGDYRLLGPYDLSSFKGRRIGFAFIVNTDSTRDTNFRIDDVSIVVNGGSTGGTGCVPTRLSIGQTINTSLGARNCRAADDAFVDRYEFIGNSGDRIEISMDSSAIDTFLTLSSCGSASCGETGRGTDIASDDDGGGGTNSKISIQLPSSGTYLIRATTFLADETGNYVLRLVRQAPQGDFSVTISPPSQTVRAGETAAYTLIRNNVNNFSENISITFSDLPPNTMVPPFSGTGSLPFQLVTTSSTPPGTYTFTAKATATGGLTRTASATIQIPSGPMVNSITFDGKQLVIAGNRFGSSPKIFINLLEKTSKLKSTSDTILILKGKANKLGIKPGQNSLFIVDQNGNASNSFNFNN